MATMETTKTKAPEYLGLLDRIGTAEAAAGRYLAAWADVTPDAELACTLRMVAARETSHGEVFCRRLAELGGCMTGGLNAENAKKLAEYADPTRNDVEKFGDRRYDTDPFGELEAKMRNGDFDPLTTSLMTWYIAEERDTLCALQSACDAVHARAGRMAAFTGAPSCGPSTDAEAIMACMTEGFSRLEKSLEKLAKAVK